MPSTSGWETRKQDERVARNTDQAEFAAIIHNSSNLETGTFDDRIAGVLDDYEVVHPLGISRWADDDHILDNATSEIGIEVRRRKNVLGDAYPFRVSGNRLIYRASSTLAYEFCLAVCESPSLTEGRYKVLPRAFERLARDVLVCFLGPGAKGQRTGWPPDRDRPKRFKDLIQKLNRLTGEWVWSPDPGLPNDPNDPNDQGLDVVVWKEVSDGRAGKLFLLGQCACGDNYTSKLHELDANFTRLRKWLGTMCWAWPTRVFCTPRHIPNDADFQQINREAGLTFDRIRITLLAEGDESREYIREQARKPYADLIRLVIPGFEVGQRAPSRRPRKAEAERRSQSHGNAASRSKRRKRPDRKTPAKRHTRGS